MNVFEVPKRMSLEAFVINRRLSGISEAEIGSLFKALCTAINQHHTQKRISGGEYYEHLLVTADILDQLGFSIEIQIAGLLHDVMEDCGMSFEQIERFFGIKVAQIVQALSKDNANPDGYWDQLYLGTGLYFETLFIKMVERWHNLVTVYAFRNLERQIRFLEETTGPLCETLTRCRQLIPESYLSRYDELMVKIYTLANEKLVKARRKQTRNLSS